MPDAWLLDTNILLRMSREEEPLHATIALVLRKLSASGARLCFTSQILGEFWNVATRPQDKNGIGFSIAQVLELTQSIERNFEFLPDSRAIHDRWRFLLETHEVRGVQVHDARIAASMFVHGVTRILTINVRDFSRYTGIQAIHPGEVFPPGEA